MAFVADGKSADYSIQVIWAPSPKAAWLAWASRRDNALIYEGENSDYVQLLRDTCRLIRADLKDWTLPDDSLPQEEGQSTRADLDRYELRDVRNGNVITSAIFDRQTGRVWVWTSVKGKNGSDESYFMAEEVLSYTRSPKPDPDAETK
jgi:hypothetical protein